MDAVKINDKEAGWSASNYVGPYSNSKYNKSSAFLRLPLKSIEITKAEVTENRDATFQTEEAVTTSFNYYCKNFNKYCKAEPNYFNSNHTQSITNISLETKDSITFLDASKQISWNINSEILFDYMEEVANNLALEKSRPTASNEDFETHISISDSDDKIQKIQINREFLDSNPCETTFEELEFPALNFSAWKVNLTLVYRYVTVPTDVWFTYTYYWDNNRQYEATNIPGNGILYFPVPVCFMTFEQIEAKKEYFEGWGEDSEDIDVGESGEGEGGEDIENTVNISYKVSTFLKSIFVAFFLFLV